MKSKLTAVLLSVILVVAMAACAPSQPPAAQEQPAPSVWPLPDGANIAALGENTVPAMMYAYFFLVYRSDFEHSALVFGFGPDDMDEFWELEQAGVTLRQVLLDESMSSAKEYAALYRAAAAAGMYESETSAASADERIATLLSQMDDDEEQFFEAYKLTPSQMREVMRQIQIAAAYLNQAMVTIEVTPEAVRAAYDADPDAFDQVTVRHILISSDDDMIEESQEAERDFNPAGFAEGLLARVNAGEDFGALALEFSGCPSRYEGGELVFGQGTMVEEFEQWSFAAAPGDTGVVRTGFGYHVMQMRSRTGFEDADMTALEIRARTNLFYETYSEIYEAVNSDEWEYNQALLDQFIALLFQEEEEE